MDYKDTLNMPVTDFPMRGNLGQREKIFQEHWEKIDLYNRVLEKNKGKTPFILHDGPPYANGNIHIGHAFQKTLKDFVLRYKSMNGFYVPYIPGFDTHGLPIENEVIKKGVNRKEVPRADFRKVCREYAQSQIEKQTEQFKRLGILGQWDKPYVTMSNDFVHDQILIFAEMAKKGLIYRGLKPVYWSPTLESALAEAEIEYIDKQSISIYFKFDLVDAKDELKDASLLVWTTTPWTLPGNLAVSANPTFNYVVFESNKGKFVAVDTLLDSLTKTLELTDVKVLTTIKGRDLEGLTYRHPLFDRVSPIILGDHVTDTDGTGLVHTAPGHGEDDYKVSRSYKLDVLSPVDDRGYMTEEAGKFAGQFYEVANKNIVDEMEAIGHLLKQNVITHSYPHDWRTRKPVIFRATPQWFASVKAIKEDLLDAVKTVTWKPTWGELRLSNMIESREDWVVSRQRAWGVPIPIFYAEDGEPILDYAVMEHVAKLFLEFGSDVWYEKEAKDLLPEGFTHPGSPNGLFTKEEDIMDVWFDSGTSYRVLERRGLPFPADLYLEGSDQYRGWFNSSLSTSVAVYNKAPYKQIVSHGFVLDGQGRKMSKSIGNVIDPLKVISQQGADIIRLWVATTDYQSDVRISDDILKQIAEAYRKIRNTIRFMLGNINDFDPEMDYIAYSMRGQLNRLMTLKYYNFVNEVIDAYDNYEFDDVYRRLMPFIINDLSAFYLDYTKDILYIEAKDDFERRAVQSTLYDITLGLLKLLTPIIPHTTSEAYLTLPHRKYDDVYLEYMPRKTEMTDVKLLDAFDIFSEVRDAVFKQLEIAREEKVIGKSLQAKVNLTVTEKQKEAIDYLDMKIHQVLIVSKVDLTIGKTLSVEVELMEGSTCERCWNVFDHIHEDGLCDRCHHVLKEK